MKIYTGYSKGNIKINSVRARGGWVKKVRKKYLDGGCQDIFWRKTFFFSYH